jgi:hypothetical protein
MLIDDLINKCKGILSELNSAMVRGRDSTVKPAQNSKLSSQADFQ